MPFVWPMQRCKELIVRLGSSSSPHDFQRLYLKEVEELHLIFTNAKSLILPDKLFKLRELSPHRLCIYVQHVFTSSFSGRQQFVRDIYDLLIDLRF